MRMRLLCLVLFIFYATTAASPDQPTKEYLDPKDDEDNVILWESLFTKINTLLNETTKLHESQNQLNGSLVKLYKGYLGAITHLPVLIQNAQNLDFTKFMENTQKQLMELKTGQQAQDHKLTKFMEQYFSNNHEWTTILRRQDGSIDFYRNWSEYQKGFGNPDGEFFIGLDRLHAMTASGAPQELIVILKDFENQTRIAKYDLFQIGNATEKYALKELGTYSGDAGDSLAYQKGMKFTTYDQDNDVYEAKCCAEVWKGAWWFKNCYDSHLFGPYKSEKESKTKGVGWKAWKGHEYSLKFAEMKVRSKHI